jgi:hypothetical protein
LGVVGRWEGGVTHGEAVSCMLEGGDLEVRFSAAAMLGASGLAWH